MEIKEGGGLADEEGDGSHCKKCKGGRSKNTFGSGSKRLSVRETL